MKYLPKTLYHCTREGTIREYEPTVEKCYRIDIHRGAYNCVGFFDHDHFYGWETKLEAIKHRLKEMKEERRQMTLRIRKLKARLS